MNDKNKLPEQPKETQLTLSQEQFSGPIPHPLHLEHYERVIPGAGKLIVNMAKDQAEHRQYLEKKIVKSANIQSYLGQIFAFIIGMTVILTGAFLVYHNKQLSGMISIVGALGALISIFVYGKKQEEADLKKKQNRDK